MNAVRSFAISQSMGIKRKIERLVFFFRFEEFVALLFLAPATYFTFKAVFFFQAQGDVPRRFSGGVVRLIVVLGIPLKNAVVDTVYPNVSVDVVTRHDENELVVMRLLSTVPLPLLFGFMDRSKDENAWFAL